MIVIINNSEKPINQVSWTNKIKKILKTICPKSDTVIINEKNEINYANKRKLKINKWKFCQNLSNTCQTY